MVKCNVTSCIHNKDNVCTRDNIQITRIHMCDNCKYPPDPNAFLGVSQSQTAYESRKHMLFF